MKHKVVLIGGAPGVGKSTLGQALAARIGAISLTVDDLLIAAKAVTTAQSHPGLHIMTARNYIDYFTASSVDQLTADAAVQHEAVWPAVEKVIRKHIAWGPPIVIDGWAIRPRKVVELDLEEVTSFWLVAGPLILEERERRNAGFFGGSPDPERMLQNFLGRSIQDNELIEREATELQMNLLRQDGRASVETLCGMAATGLAKAANK